ncbi:MAG: uracil-DNA glycosylase family protein [Pseudomonadota bacterium]|nr:uracil-DNA glycosylase family protein [Pseudomonadota bacterium]
MQNLEKCRYCKRIQKNLKQLKKLYPSYHNQPVLSTGLKISKICVVGLAPGLHGANRTGKPFNGDFSGKLLHKVLNDHKFTIRDKYHNYKPIYITNSVKCYPPNNAPVLDEIKKCQRYLIQEFNDLKDLKVIIALGHIAHNAVLRAFSMKLSLFPFAHEKIHEINSSKFLLDSYHCSKININSKKLDISRLSKIFRIAKEIAYKR